jgi:hypothetical protein
MPTKKKTGAKSPAARKPRASSSAGARSTAVRASAPEIQASKRIQMLVVTFTLLSVVFAAVAYWRYA